MGRHSIMLAILAALNIGISAGAGLGHDLAGFRLDARYEQLTVSAATGILMFPVFTMDSTDYRSAAFGLRWSSSPAGDRFFVAGHYLFAFHRDIGGGHHVNAATVTAGWRFKGNVLFADVGAGGGFRFKNEDNYRPALVPDITLAVGAEF